MGWLNKNILLANFMPFSLFCWQDGSSTDILDLIGSCIADIVQQVRRQSLSSRLIRTAAGLKLWGDDTLPAQLQVDLKVILTFNFSGLTEQQNLKKIERNSPFFVVLKWKKHTCTMGECTILPIQIDFIIFHGFLPIFPPKMGMKLHSYGFRNRISGEAIILQHYGNWPRVYVREPKDGLKEWNPMADLQATASLLTMLSVALISVLVCTTVVQ